MTMKQAQKRLEEINKLPKKEREFTKNLYLYKYLILVAHKGKVDPFKKKRDF